MTEPAVKLNPATAIQRYARRTLDRLERCDGIKPVRGGDEQVCANDQLPLVGSPLIHDPEAIRDLQEMAGR